MQTYETFARNLDRLVGGEQAVRITVPYTLLASEAVSSENAAPLVSAPLPRSWAAQVAPGSTISGRSDPVVPPCAV